MFQITFGQLWILLQPLNDYMKISGILLRLVPTAREVLSTQDSPLTTLSFALPCVHTRSMWSTARLCQQISSINIKREANELSERFPRELHLGEYISALTLFRSCWPMWGCGPQNGNSLCVCWGGREALAPHESWGCRIQRQTVASEAFWMAVTTVGASDRSACREGFGRIPGRGQMPEAS